MYLNGFSSLETMNVKVSNGDHPKDKPKAVQDKSKPIQVQMISKEIDYLVGSAELSPPASTRIWPIFVTLVS